MKDVGQQSAAVAALRQAVPYIRLFKGKTFVVKVGGAALGADDAAARVTLAVLEQVLVLHQVGIRVVLVHGGGPQSTSLSRALGAEPRFVAGRRVTDDAALEVAALVLNGAVNTRLLAACRTVGLPAVGLSGVAAGLLQARRRGPVTVAVAGSGGSGGSAGAGTRKAEPAAGPAGMVVDYGHVGDIEAVDPGVLETLLAAGVVPVVSPLSADERGALLNVNADTAAAALAVALGAEKLLLLTAAPGILERPGDPGSLVSLTDLAGLARLRERGCLEDGMLPKASSIEAALRGGVRRVHIVGAGVPDGLLAEVFTNEGVGTLVVADAAAAYGTPAAGGADGPPAAGGAGGAGGPLAAALQGLPGSEP
ncbi:MAG TPA: acetylglutamate kinase [Thermoanaerobaculia bacterium]|jgi:acetylglutamate kinase|nr:acetylglutamate kinase [Thermoanaerobaculia bacterium]